MGQVLIIRISLFTFMREDSYIIKVVMFLSVWACMQKWGVAKFLGKNYIENSAISTALTEAWYLCQKPPESS